MGTKTGLDQGMWRRGTSSPVLQRAGLCSVSHYEREIMPAGKVAIGQKPDRIKHAEITSQSDLAGPARSQTCTWRRCHLLFFISASIVCYPCNHGRTHFEKFPSGLPCADGSQRRKTPIKNVRSRRMTASSSLWCQSNESRIPSSCPNLNG